MAAAEEVRKKNLRENIPHPKQEAANFLKEKAYNRASSFTGFRHHEAAPHGGVTVSTGLFAAKRHAGGWAPVIARKMIIADHQLAYAA
jgi:hypothetical protein